MPESHLWWQQGVIYQIYPRSFMDSNADGIGDLPGITARLDYLQWLGVDAIWISPIFPSPMVDFGYDITDYTGIEPMFGTLDDFDRLIAAAHARNLKVLLDFVPNHTSDRHPWFREAQAARDSAKRDWYLWHDPAPDGGPPTNWLSRFGGSGWEWDAPTGQYYYHTFLKEQPDLNWRNPAVRAAMFAGLRFWLDRGVDGFRVDAVYFSYKDAQWRDNPPNPNARSADPWGRYLQVYTQNRPEMHDLMREMRAILDAYPERVMIGEIYLSYSELMKYYGAELDECHLPFNFGLISDLSDPDSLPAMPWQAAAIEEAIEEYEAALPPGGWPNWVLSNHDQHRIASRIGPRQARIAQMLLLTLRGTPTLYYGDELGMQDVPIPPEQVVDPWEKNVPGMGLGRDPERTPMQWSSTTHAGFSPVAPWLPVGENYREYNVEVESAQPHSVLTLTRHLLALRRAVPALHISTYQTVTLPAPNVLAYVRRHADQQFLIVLNLGRDSLDLDLSSVASEATVVLSTHLDREGTESPPALRVRADEGLILVLSA
jgi:alpha-glucosidase